MTLSIRARLTAWYSAIVVLVLVTGAIAAAVEHRRLGLHRLDEELRRLMLTLEGVMRTEIKEGLTLAESGKEASAEVVAPDRVMLLELPSSATIAWGRPLPGPWALARVSAGYHTIDAGGHRVRVFRRDVSYGGYEYVAGVGATLDELETQHRELVVSITVGVSAGLAVAGFGGWWIGYRTLRPLAEMAMQAAAISGQAPAQRLHALRSDDELGQFAKAFNALLDRLSTAMRAQRQFMADASHQLRTPVSIMRTTAQVALGRTERSSDDYRESLTVVAEQGALVTSLVDGMFLLARADAVGLPLRRELLYLDDLIAECVRGLRVLADWRHVTIGSGPVEETAFSGDAILLRQMISNLLDNGIRHAVVGGAVTVSLTRASSVASISVEDDGVGVALADRERIFERFVRCRSESDGAGLGLPIARWVAEVHGGRLDLADGDRANRFVVTLPI
jgi:signal transduction histidine kinase